MKVVYCCVLKDKDTNYFSSLSKDRSHNCSEIDFALNQPHTTNAPSSMYTSAAPPDLIQNKTIPSSKEDLQVKTNHFAFHGFQSFYSLGQWSSVDSLWAGSGLRATYLRTLN